MCTLFIVIRKNSKRPSIDVLLAKNWEIVKGSWYNAVYLKLTTETTALLKSWSRKAASVLNNYLQDRFSYYLREIRFDFLPDENRENFIIPDLPLENVRFSDKPRGADRVAADYFASSTLDDIRAAEHFYAIIHKNENTE